MGEFTLQELDEVQADDTKTKKFRFMLPFDVSTYEKNKAETEYL